MNNIIFEDLIWLLTYTAAVGARDPEPGFKADDAIMHYRGSPVVNGVDEPDPLDENEGDLPF